MEAMGDKDDSNASAASADRPVWAINLVQWCKDNGGMAQMRRILELRGLGKVGGYKTAEKLLSRWNRESRLDEIFEDEGGYRACEPLELEASFSVRQGQIGARLR